MVMISRVFADSGSGMMIMLGILIAHDVVSSERQLCIATVMAPLPCLARCPAVRPTAVLESSARGLSFNRPYPPPGNGGERVDPAQWLAGCQPATALLAWSQPLAFSHPRDPPKLPPSPSRSKRRLDGVRGC